MPLPPDALTRSLPGDDDLPDYATSLELLAKAQTGNQAALEQLIGRYQERLRRIVRIQLGASMRREVESMDIVQNTFRAALPKVGDLRPRTAAGLLQWLAMIATNQIRDARDYQLAAKRDIRRRVFLDKPGDEGPTHQAEAEGIGPEKQALLNEVRELLDDEVAGLPDDQRRVVVLRDYCGETWERVAAELDRGTGAARQLHQRAWIHLRRALRPKLEGQDPV